MARTRKFITLITARLYSTERLSFTHTLFPISLHSARNRMQQSSGLNSSDSLMCLLLSSSHFSFNFIGKYLRLLSRTWWELIYSFCSFILHSIFRTIIVGFLQTSSDNLLKPILAVIFNGFLQLLFTFVQNIFQSICDMLHPLTVLAENVLKPFTECLRAFRIVDIRNLRKDIPHRHGENLAWNASERIVMV